MERPRITRMAWALSSSAWSRRTTTAAARSGHRGPGRSRRPGFHRHHRDHEFGGDLVVGETATDPSSRRSRSRAWARERHRTSTLASCPVVISTDTVIAGSSTDSRPRSRRLLPGSVPRLRIPWPEPAAPAYSRQPGPRPRKVVNTSTGGTRWWSDSVPIQLTRGLHSADSFHPQIHDDDVRGVGGDRRRHLITVGAFGHHVETVFAAQDPSQTRPHQF